MTHSEGCPLYSVHWLRHAVACAGRLADQQTGAGIDPVTAIALTDALAHFAELPEWEGVTLKDVAEHATLMDTPTNRERFGYMCKCGALGL